MHKQGQAIGVCLANKVP